MPFSFLRLHHFGLVLLGLNTYGFAGELCGSKEGWVNRLASLVLIPDSFPPETEMLRSLVSETDLQRCENEGPVSLSPSCERHDGCYERRESKAECDSRLQDEWVQACRQQYRKLTRNHLLCRIACENFVKLMSEAQKYDNGQWCPSCSAYDSIGAN